MSIVSLKFILFVSLCLILYYAFPKLQRFILLTASLAYYIFASGYYVFFLLFTMITTWVCPLIMYKCKRKRFVLMVSIFFNVFILAFLKYVPLTGYGLEKIILPLGISFYTFQSIGYCVDAYRNIIEPERNIIKYSLFVSFFPQISQGPIGRYSNLSKQLYIIQHFNYDSFVLGLERALIGYFKKIVIADNIAVIVNTIYGEPSRYSGLFIAAATILYALQLYADFSGYTDIVLGVAQLFGISLTENFNTPYFSKSISEFWRRWHISLGSWFRDYVYIPLGGNRCSVVRHVINLLIVWVLTGIWHGGNLTFVFWGISYFLLLLIEKYVPAMKKMCNTPFGHIYTLFFVVLLWIPFRTATFKETVYVFTKIFSKWYYEGWTGGVFWYTEKSYWGSLAFSVASCIALDFVERKQRFAVAIEKIPLIAKWIIVWMIFFITTYFALYSQAPHIDSSNFIYFNF